MAETEKAAAEAAAEAAAAEAEADKEKRRGDSPGGKGKKQEKKQEKKQGKKQRGEQGKKLRLGQLVNNIRSQETHVKGRPERMAWLNARGTVYITHISVYNSDSQGVGDLLPY